MREFSIIFFMLISLNIHSMVQLEVGVAVANDIENNISKLGVGTSFTILPKVSLGAGV